MLIQKGKIRKIHSISESQAQEIKNYLQGAIEEDPCRRYETKKEAFTRMYRWVKE